MKEIRVEKVTLNIGTGEPGGKLDKAIKLLGSITGEKPIATKARSRIPTWGIRPGLLIGCKVTLRKKKAELLLKRLITAVSGKISERKFDVSGNLSFGIKEYIDIPDAKYDPSIGIIGLDAAVTLSRPGYRIKERMLKKARIGRKHVITKQDAMKFMQEKFNVEVVS